MRHFIKVLFLLFFCFTIFSASAQTGEILKELEKNKSNNNNNGSSYNSNSSNIRSFFFFVDLFRLMGVGIARLQRIALNQRPDYREITSIEAFLTTGYYSKYNSVLLAPQIRANWGIFSTDFRYQSIEDRTFYLETYDWQVLKLNVPIKHFKGSFGIGFTNIPQVKTSYFEYSVGGQLRFKEELMLAEIMYREAPGFRQELRMSIDYEIKNYPISKNAQIHISPMIGFNYQNYFDLFYQYYIIGGLNIRLY